MDRIDGGQYKKWLGARGVRLEHVSAHEHALRLFESMGGCTQEAMNSFIRLEVESGKEAARIRNLEAVAKHILMFQREQEVVLDLGEPAFELELKSEILSKPSSAPQSQGNRIGRGTTSGQDVSSRPEPTPRKPIPNVPVTQYQIGDVCGCAAPPSPHFDEVPLTLVGSVASFLGIIGFIFLGFWLFFLIEASVLLFASAAALYFSRWKCVECNERIETKHLGEDDRLEQQTARRKFAAIAIVAAFLVSYSYRGWSTAFDDSIPALEQILEEKAQVDQKWADEVQKQRELNHWQPGDSEEDGQE